MHNHRLVSVNYLLEKHRLVKMKTFFSFVYFIMTKDLFIKYLTIFRSWRYRSARSKWVTGVKWRTWAYGSMTDAITNGIEATRTWTRISTFLVHTSLVAWAIRIYGTLWSTSWGTSYIVGHASTGCWRADFSTFWIRSTWRRQARIYFFDRS